MVVDVIEVKYAKALYLRSVDAMEKEAANYRVLVNLYYEYHIEQGQSGRAVAKSLDITEGALRHLLRPSGMTRKVRRGGKK